MYYINLLYEWEIANGTIIYQNHATNNQTVGHLTVFDDGQTLTITQDLKDVKTHEGKLFIIRDRHIVFGGVKRICEHLIFPWDSGE